jgi:seryl-tRNA synthetase
MLKKDSSAPSRILPLNIPPSRSIPESTELQTKDQLIEKIKEWVKIDNEIRTLQTELNKRKENKKKVSTELMNVMKRNEIDVFDIKDGQIIYDKRNVKKPVTKAALMSILSTYYNGDVVKAAEINQYIMDNREEVVREKIIRKSRGTYGSPRAPLP